MAGSSMARARWELENNIQTVERVDSLFQYNAAEQQQVQQQRPWKNDPHFFKRYQRDERRTATAHAVTVVPLSSVQISALALLKMAMHARSGGTLEARIDLHTPVAGWCSLWSLAMQVMGMLQGKVVGNSFVVIDTYALPVEGTETRVNAASEANEYMVNYNDTSKVCNAAGGASHAAVACRKCCCMSAADCNAAA
jgi:COP9 signalosome complex subunit 5